MLLYFDLQLIRYFHCVLFEIITELCFSVYLNQLLCDIFKQNVLLQKINPQPIHFQSSTT